MRRTLQNESKSLVSPRTRIYYKIVSRAEFQKLRACRSGYRRLLPSTLFPSLSFPPSFWTGGELDKSSFLRSLARTLADAFKKSDTKGGRDASTCQAKISDLSIPSFDFLWESATVAQSVTISFRSSRVRDLELWLVTKISIFVSPRVLALSRSTTPRTRDGKYLTSFREWPFPTSLCLSRFSSHDIYQTCLLASFVRNLPGARTLLS